MEKISNLFITSNYLSNDYWIEKYKRKDLKIDIKEQLKPASRCCIYRVPIMLRQINQEAYTPQLISIGPLHYGRAELVNMERQKIRYKEDFGTRIKICKEWQGFINFIKQKEQDIRDCYAESTSHFQSHAFIIMILYDAIFIIELFLKSYRNNKDDFLVNNPSLKDGLCLDLQLLENQLPFFVLKELYELAFDNPTGEVMPSFVTLTCNFFQLVEHNTEEFEHFVDLRRKVLVKDLPHPKEKESSVLPSTAVKLSESGVKFKSINDDSLLNIKFEKGNLQIPHIIKTDQTESLFRNMMALEQCHYPSQTHVCNYIHLMDSLINSEKDVDFLVEKKIITNMVGDHAAVAQMFNKLCRHIAISESSCYKDTIEDLKTHQHSTRAWWNRTMASLVNVYFCNLWRGTATVTALILLALTILQTIYTIW